MILLLGIVIGGLLFGGAPCARRGCFTAILVVLGVLLLLRILFLFAGFPYRRRFIAPGFVTDNRLSRA